MTSQANPAAPEIKAYPDTVTAAFEDFMGTFEAFKETNDRRLGEIEKKLTADVVTEEKLDRINRAIDENKKVLDDMLLKKSRPPLYGGRDARGGREDHEYKAAFDAYIRRGDETGLRQLEAKGLPALGVYAGTSQSEGQNLFLPQLEDTIGRRIAQISPMRRLATVREISTLALRKPFVSASLQPTWADEKNLRSQTVAQTLTDLNFTTYEMYASPFVTQTLLEDAAVDMEAWIASEVDIAFAEAESSAFVNGDGKNKPFGVFAQTAVTDGSWSWGSLGYVATGAAGTWKSSTPSDTLIEVIYALKSGYRQNGTFMMNRKTQSDIRKFKDTANNYIWQPPTAPGLPPSLMGYPIAEAEDAPDMSSTANPVPAGTGFAIAFGDFRAGYLIVDRRGMTILRDPFSNKPYVTFYVTKRVGGGIQNYEAIKYVKFALS